MKYRLLIISIISSLFFACDLPNQPGPMPNDIIETEFTPGLNILGILYNSDTTESFIYIEEALPTDTYYENMDSNIVTNAEIIIWGEKDTTKYKFIIQPDVDSCRYINKNFIPISGEKYYLKISARTDQGNLSVAATTIVPTLPEITSDSVKISDEVLNINIKSNDDIVRYDFYLFSEENLLAEKIIYSDFNCVQFNLEEFDTLPTRIEILTFDKNLTTYLQTSNTLFPQNYQENISTVEEGYGCFGAISKKNIHLEL